jgi:uncharacterized membrane protein
LADTSRNMMKQHETSLRNAVMILSFLYAGIMALLCVSFLFYYNKGGELLFLGRFLGGQGSAQSAFLSGLSLFLAWVTGIGAALSGLSGYFLLRSNEQKILEVVEVESNEKVKQVENKAKEKVKEVEDKAEKEVSADVLTEDEQKIVNILEDHQNVSTQKEIVSESKMTKVKVHRILKKLEAKKIISKYDFGMTKRIRLEKNLKK